MSYDFMLHWPRKCCTTCFCVLFRSVHNSYLCLNFNVAQILSMRSCFVAKVCSCALNQLQTFFHVASFRACALVLNKYKAIQLLSSFVLATLVYTFFFENLRSQFNFCLVFLISSFCSTLALFKINYICSISLLFSWLKCCDIRLRLCGMFNTKTMVPEMQLQNLVLSRLSTIQESVSKVCQRGNFGGKWIPSVFFFQN